MVNRKQNFEKFAQLFYAKEDIDNPPTISYEELVDAEQQLAVIFPKSYVEFLVEGPGPCPMHKLDISAYYEQMEDESEDPVPLVDYFYQMDELLDENIDSRWEDMPQDLVAIACDHEGNYFGFDLNDSDGCDEDHRKDDMPVYFWDQDSEELTLVDQSFEHWISGYLALPVGSLE